MDTEAALIGIIRRGGLGPCPRLFAEGGGEVVQDEAVGTEEVGGGGIAAHRAGRDVGRRVGEARERMSMRSVASSRESSAEGS